MKPVPAAVTAVTSKASPAGKSLSGCHIGPPPGVGGPTGLEIPSVDLGAKLAVGWTFALG